jgi:serine/threonine protein kinase
MKKIGRYEVIEELGHGAMGVVYKASDPTIGRLVAIKVLLLDSPTEAGVPGARDIFMREARAAGRLSHPGIVTIHDALEDPESRSSYIVMEFIPGRTLESVLVAEPSPGIEKALDIVRQVADALDYAHRNQIIHRDLKPANIILTEDGRVKITDFGIAKIAAREGAARTLAVMGTPAYMSPEQVTGGEVDARSDLFSMGILLYLMLVGQRPFAGDTAAVMFKIVYEDPVLPSRLNPQLSGGHDYLALRCLAKDRAKRYTSAREFLDDLEDVRQGRRPRSEAKLPMSQLRAGERTVMAQRPFITPTEKAREERKKLRHVLTGAIAGMLLVGLLGLGGWLLFEWRESTTPPPPAQTAAAPAEASSPAPSASKGTVGSASQKVVPAEAPRKAPPEGTTKATGAPATAAQPQPTVASAAATGSPAAKSATVPAAATPAATKPPPGTVVTLQCTHQLQEATLLILDGSTTIFQSRLIGKKKRGFPGIRGGYSGSLTEPLTIPASTRQLTVRVYSADGSVNVLNKISAVPPSSAANTLRVAPTRQQLTLQWTEGTPTAR